MSKPKFAIGSGHGLYTAGKRCMKAIDPKETREWYLNDRIADKVEAKLANYDCEFIRVDDTTGELDIALGTRVANVNKFNPDMYISIHHNAGINGGTGGGTVIYHYGNDERVRQAKALYDAIVCQTGLVGNRSGKVLKNNYYVLKYTNCPALLIENGFMDSRTDVPIILTEAHAEKTAVGIVNFLVAEFDLKAKGKKEEVVNSKVNAKVLEFQRCAIADGFSFPRFGADGYWGGECEGVAKEAIVKNRGKLNYKYTNLTKIVQRAVGVEADGKCGNLTDEAIRRYQAEHGLKPDGCVGLLTWKVILGV